LLPAQHPIHHGRQGELLGTPLQLAAGIDSFAQVGINGFGRIGRIVFRNA
jgi:hypothetical protein